MSARFIPAVFLLASLVAAVAGSARDWKTDDRGVLTAIARAPVKVRAWENPYAGKPDAILAGEKIFRRHCAGCHGEDARGRGRSANLRSPAVQNAAPGELVWLLRNGNLRAGMPSWSGMPDERLWQIAAYLKMLR